jgi:hypothetical protein
MTKPMVKIVNAETGEEVEREMNATELAQLQKDQVSANAERAEVESNANARAAVLAKLGLTDEEAAALLA